MPAAWEQVAADCHSSSAKRPHFDFLFLPAVLFMQNLLIFILDVVKVMADSFLSTCCVPGTAVLPSQ